MRQRTSSRVLRSALALLGCLAFLVAAGGPVAAGSSVAATGAAAATGPDAAGRHRAVPAADRARSLPARVVRPLLRFTTPVNHPTATSAPVRVTVAFSPLLVDRDSLLVTVNGRDVSSSFRVTAPGTLAAELYGRRLVRGENTVVVTARSKRGSLALTDTAQFGYQPKLVGADAAPVDTHGLTPFVSLFTHQLGPDGQFGIGLGPSFIPPQAQVPPVSQGYQVMMVSRGWTAVSGQWVTPAVVYNVAWPVTNEAQFQSLQTFLTTPSSYQGCTAASAAGCYLIVSSLTTLGWTSCPAGVGSGSACTPSTAQPGALFASLGGSLSASFAPGQAAVGYSLVAPVTVTVDSATNQVEAAFAGPSGGTEALSCVLTYNVNPGNGAVTGGCTPRPGPQSPLGANIAGSVVGAFVEGASDYLRFSSTQPIAVNARALSTVDGSTVNTVTVNGQAYPSDPTVAPVTGAAGFQVVQIDRSTMGVLANNTYQVRTLGNGSDLTAMAAALADPVNGSNEDTLWVISSLGFVDSLQAGSAYSQVAVAVQAIGGSFPVFSRLGNPPSSVSGCPSSGDYTLLGWQQPAPQTGLPVGRGLEASGTVLCATQGSTSPAATDVTQSALLALDARSFSTPQSWAPLQLPYGLQTGALQLQQAGWPAAIVDGTVVPGSSRTAGQAAAYADISNQLQTKGGQSVNGDLRSQYVDAVNPFNAGWASGWLSDLAAVTDTPGTGYQPGDLTSVLAELTVEITQLNQVVTFQTTVDGIYQAVAGTGSNSLTSAYAAVAASLTVSDSSDVAANTISTIGAIAGDIVPLLEAIPGADVIGAGIDVFAEATSFGLSLSEDPDTGAPLGKLTTTWGELAGDMNAIFIQATDGVNTLAQLAATDAVRLSAVAAAAQTMNASIGADDVTPTDVEAGIGTSLTVTFYGALLGSQYQAYNKVYSHDGNPVTATTSLYPTPAGSLQDVVCDAGSACAAQSAPVGDYSYTLYGPASGGGWSWGANLAAGYVDCSIWHRSCSARFPPASIMNNLFSTLDPTQPQQLGQWPDYFFGPGGPLPAPDSDDDCNISRTGWTSCG